MTKRPFLARNIPFPFFPGGISNALVVLMLVFFMVPFALRGARLALDEMKNDIKDWLPSSFAETEELEWFRKQFLGEQFVVASWEGCTADDQRLQLLVKKLMPENLNQKRGFEPADASDPDAPGSTEFVGDRLGLFRTGDDHLDWGGKDEKWFKGIDKRWYYLTPDGELHRWMGESSLFGSIVYHTKRLFSGNRELEGEPIATVDPRCYQDPWLMEAQLFKTVTTGPMVLEQLAGPGGSLRRDTGTNEDASREAHALALERLEGALYGPDGKQTCLIVTLTDVAKQDLHRVVGRPDMPGEPTGRLVTLAADSGIPYAQLHMGGPPIDNVAIDEEGKITLIRLIGYSVALGLFLAYMSFRSIKITIMIFFVGGVSAVSSLSIVWFGGSTLDAIVMSMPSLVYVLGLSGAVHIINYYRDAVVEQGVEGAAERALAHGWWPCTLAATTTAIGLFALTWSDLTPIAKFGLYSGLGVMATLLLLFTYLPAALHMWPPVRKKSEIKESAFSKAIFNFWDGIGHFVVRYNRVIAITCLLVMGGFALGVYKIKTSVQLLKLFDGDAKIIHDYEWLEANLGKLVPMELVLRVESDLIRPTDEQFNQLTDQQKQESRFQLSLLERFELVTRVHSVLEEEFGEEGRDVVGKAMSMSTFTPELPAAGGSFSDIATRGAFNRQMQDHAQEFLDSDYLRYDEADDAELWRVSLRLGALNDVDYGTFVKEFKRAVEPIMVAYKTRNELLRKLDQQTDGKGFAKANVLYLVGPADEQPPAERPETANGEQTGTEQTGTEQTGALDPVLTQHEQQTAEVNQTAIFTGTLDDLLINARLSKPVQHDYDPAELTAEQLAQDATSDKFAQALQRFDAVVLVNDSPLYDQGFIKEHSKLVIDARDHRFRAENFQTANQAEAPISTIYTGVVPIVYKAQRELMTSLFRSMESAFLMIACVMMLLLNPGKFWTWGWFAPRNLGTGALAGLLSMVPNMFPVIVIFGAMGHFGVLVDIGSMMTASVALGVAVDDTIHFLTWFRDGLKRGLHRREAITAAYGKVALAMTQTTAIGGLGLAVFALSTFTPTQRFGTLMLALLMAALVGDLIFLPALLAGPLGAIFRTRKEKPDDAAGARLATEQGTLGEEHPAESDAAASEGGQDGEKRDRTAATPHSRSMRREGELNRIDGPHGE
jgi:uncharacterized protein